MEYNNNKEIYVINKIDNEEGQGATFVAHPKGKEKPVIQFTTTDKDYKIDQVITDRPHYREEFVGPFRGLVVQIINYLHLYNYRNNPDEFTETFYYCKRVKDSLNRGMIFIDHNVITDEKRLSILTNKLLEICGPDKLKYIKLDYRVNNPALFIEFVGDTEEEEYKFYDDIKRAYREIVEA